jgi:hypothetical protein
MKSDLAAAISELIGPLAEPTLPQPEHTSRRCQSRTVVAVP